MMAKIVKRVKRFKRNVEEEIWKRRCKEFTSFKVYESGFWFEICMMFEDDIEVSEKERISTFLESALKREDVNFVIALENVRQRFNVGVSAQGADGNKILVFVKKW